MTIIAKIPKELQQLPQWCVVKIELPKRKGRHKRKIPINPITGDGASSSDPSTWVDFRTASRLYREKREYDGLGFFFNNDYIGIDFDDMPEEIETFKKDPKRPDNKINWLNRLTRHSYLEVSQSGNGIHAIVKGSYPYPNNRKGKYEIYGKGRFFALTGNIINNQKTIKTISKRNLEELYTSTVGRDASSAQKTVEVNQEMPKGNNLSIDEIIKRMYSSSNGIDIKKLIDGNISGYSSQSEADIALCNHLAYWTAKDPKKMDAIFRQSKLFRSKWDEKHGTSTYGQQTIAKAIRDTPNVYTGKIEVASTENNYSFEFNEEPKTIKKLEEQLIKLGIAERKVIQAKLEADNSKKKAKISIIRAVKILQDHLIWAILKEPKEEKWQDTAQLYFYNFESGLYDNSTLIIDKLINCLEPQFRINDSKEIKEKLRINSRRLILTRNPNLYALGNCIFDASKNKTINYSFNYVFTAKIPINYNPNAKEPKFDNWSFSKWINEDIAQGNPDKIKLIRQAFKALINANYSYHTALFLVDDGHGSTGKGTFEELLINITGGNYASIRIKAFEKDAYLSSIVNKPLIIGDDNAKNRKIKDEFINNPELLEWIVKEAIETDIDGVMIETKESNEILKQNKIDSDPVLQFINECVTSTDIAQNRPLDDTYRVFKNWFKDRGKRLAELPEYREFNKSMREYGFKSGPRKIKGRGSIRCWIGLRLSSDCDSIPDFEFNK